MKRKLIRSPIKLGRVCNSGQVVVGCGVECGWSRCGRRTADHCGVRLGAMGCVFGWELISRSMAKNPGRVVKNPVPRALDSCLSENLYHGDVSLFSVGRLLTSKNAILHDHPHTPGRLRSFFFFTPPR